MKPIEYSGFATLRALALGAKSYCDAPEEVKVQISQERDTLISNMKTANGIKIVEGLRVWTNDLTRGTIDFKELDFEFHNGENRWVPWFTVNIDMDHNGQSKSGSVSQSNDRVTTRYQGQPAYPNAFLPALQK